MMKHIIRISQLSLLIIAILFSNTVASQIEVGLLHADGNKENLSQTHLMRLKNSRCEVIVPQSMKTPVQEAMENHWIITDWTLYTDSERNTQPSDTVSVFTLSVESGPTAQTPKISLELLVKNFNGETIRIAEIILFPDAELIAKIQSINSPEAQRHELFQQGKFYNAENEFLSHNIRAINDQLNKGKSIWFDDDYSSQAHIKMLKNKTLGIPEYCFLRRNMLNGKDEAYEEDKLMKHFPYNWEKAENSDTRFVFLYAQSGAATFISIFDTLSGQIIYQTKSSNKYKLSSKDFKTLAKQIG
ncbi:MAG: hypothetical protein PF448_07265 [Bacteroidales bacterium]|jgi:hypothetical protein|nr:hypothetical protein [Bacteroidales bacterium]